MTQSSKKTFPNASLRVVARRSALVLTCAALAGGCNDDDSSDDPNPPGAQRTSTWTAEQVGRIELEDDNQAPLIELDELPRTVDGLHVWDWWPVRDREGQPTQIGGQYAAIALSAPSDVLPGKRHDIARYHLLTSPDGREWTSQGDLFPAEDRVFGSRQWAGSAMYDEQSQLLHVFYTASGRADWEEGAAPADGGGGDGGAGGAGGAGPSTSSRPTGPSGPYFPTEGISYEQRMALAVGIVDPNPEEQGAGGAGSEDAAPFGITWGNHVVVLEADGTEYEPTRATAGGAGRIAGFRDPWYFREPETNREFLLFTANLAGSECEESGVVGVAEAVPGTSLTEWELLPPLLEADCVNQELERPHFVLHDESYYLFFSTHDFTFASNLTGPEGLYGFVADSMFGEYQPLNRSGLVLANPEEAPYQAYSWLVLPNFLVTSFVNYVDLEGLSIDEVGQQSAEYQFEHFGGVFAPTIEIEVSGDMTSIVRELGPGVISTDD